VLVAINEAIESATGSATVSVSGKRSSPHPAARQNGHPFDNLFD
jgi:hypothetical protein